jgi:regulator of protease activity HflC (stomatin/prohibitin superfamily)
MKADSRVQILLRDLRLPREERKAARLERHVEEAMRSQRDGVAYGEAARRAAAEAERQRWGGAGSPLGGGGASG